MISPGLDTSRTAEVWPECPYRVRAATTKELARPLAPNVLFAVAYENGATSSGTDPRHAVVPLARLNDVRGGEIWESRSPVHAETTGAMSVAENGEVMMIRLSIPESDLVDTEAAAARLYSELLRVTTTRGYPHLLRAWNYLGNINQGDGDDERYRRFCVGRHRAMSLHPKFEGSLPAATAIGTVNGGLILMALAGRRAGVQVENPRQLSAFRYPRAYGERSPSFSRATLLPWADGAELMVSGTASIVGHASAHPGDPQAQLKQTALNIHALVTQPGLARRGFLPDLLTLYLRDPSDLLPVLPLLQPCFSGTPVHIVQGDICRTDLLLEVEAIYRMPRLTRK